MLLLTTTMGTATAATSGLPIPALLLAVALLLSGVWLAWYQRKMSRYSTRYAGPMGLPYLGNFAVLDPAVLIEKFKELRAQYGSVFEVWFLGTRMIVVTDPKICKVIFGMRPKTFMRLRNNFKAFVDLGVESNVFAAEGKEWARFRRLTSPPSANPLWAT